MEIRNQTLYDQSLIVRYNRYYFNQFLVKTYSIVSIVTLGFMIYLFISGNWQYALTLLGILLVYLLLTFLMQSLTTKRILKKSPLVDNPILQTYVFTGSNVSIQNLKSTILDYNNIVKIRKSKAFFILFDDKKKTYIVDKSGFDNAEDIEKLNRFFQETFMKIYR